MYEVEVASATKAKTQFGSILDLSQKRPVMIQKNKRDFSVILSVDDFEDLLLSLKAYESMQKGFVGVEESERILNTFRNAQN